MARVIQNFKPACEALLSSSATSNGLARAAATAGATALAHTDIATTTRVPCRLATGERTSAPRTSIFRSASLFPFSSALAAPRDIGSMLAVAKRTYSSRAQLWEHLISLPTRRGQFSDAVQVATLLPNRASFSPQFTPHGIQLVPKAVVQPVASSAAGVALSTATPSTPVPAAATRSTATATTQFVKPSPTIVASSIHDWNTEEDVAGVAEIGMQLATDRTKQWRRLKIKKHKIKKRRKANRYKND